MKKNCSNNTGFNIFVRGLHARLAPFRFLAILSLVVLLVRAIECLHSYISPLHAAHQLLHAFNLASHALRGSFLSTLVVFFVFHFIISVLFLAADRSSRQHRHPPSAPAPAFELNYIDLFEEGDSPHHIDLPLKYSSPLSDSASANIAGGSDTAVEVDCEAFSTMRLAACKSPAFIASVQSMEQLTAWRDTCAEACFDKDSWRPDRLQIAGSAKYTASAPSWELAAEAGMISEADQEWPAVVSKSQEDGMCTMDDEKGKSTIVVARGMVRSRAVEAGGGAAGMGGGEYKYGCRQLINNCNIYYWNPSATTLYASSSSTLDSLTREEANECFSQFQAKTWDKIRGGRRGRRLPSSNSGSTALICV